MPNLLLALQLLVQLGVQVQGLATMISNAQTTGVDLTPEQLQSLNDAFNAAVSKLNADLAAAAAAAPTTA